MDSGLLTAPFITEGILIVTFQVVLAFLLGLLSGYSLFFSVTKAIKQNFFKILIINQLAQNKLDNIANINLKEIQDGDPIY